MYKCIVCGGEAKCRLNCGEVSKGCAVCESPPEEIYCAECNDREVLFTYFGPDKETPFEFIENMEDLLNATS